MDNLNRAVSGFRISLFVIAGFSFFAAILQLTIPLYMLQIYDRVLPSNSTDTLVFISILAGFALVILGLTEMIRQILGTRAAAKMDVALSGDVMEKVIREGYKTNGDTQPLKHLQSVRTMVGSKSMIGLVDLPFSLVFLICIYLVHPSLFWLTVVGIGILMGLAVFNLRLSQASNAKQLGASAVATRMSEFIARNSDSVLAMGMVQNVMNHWGKTHATGLVAADENSKVASLFGGISRTIRFGIQAAILGFGAYLVQQGEMTAGMIFASSIVAGRALQPIDVVINSWPQLNAGWSSWTKLKEFLSKSASRAEYTSVESPKGELSVDGVLQPNPLDPKKPPLLNRISFTLPAGKSVAVIGPSGSGKTTLARILVGALEPFAGDVRIDGNALKNWDPELLGKHVGYLAQDVELLPGTVAQNIARFEPDAKDEDILKAAKLAHVEDLVKKLPQAYDTVVGPGGLQVSGGEKQRIALARAFYGSPKILVLDEPNSSLDRLGEKALLLALLEAKKAGITVVVVTQREGVLQVVDMILRMNEGAITDFGDRNEIIKKYSATPEKGAAPAAKQSRSKGDEK